jgi:hypothetical protein
VFEASSFDTLSAPVPTTQSAFDVFSAPVAVTAASSSPSFDSFNGTTKNQPAAAAASAIEWSAFQSVPATASTPAPPQPVFDPFSTASTPAPPQPVFDPFSTACTQSAASNTKCEPINGSMNNFLMSNSMMYNSAMMNNNGLMNNPRPAMPNNMALNNAYMMGSHCISSLMDPQVVSNPHLNLQRMGSKGSTTNTGKPPQIGASNANGFNNIASNRDPFAGLGFK